MTERLKAFADSRDFERTKQRALDILKEAKEQSESGKIGFVSGVIKSEGSVYLVRNIKNLARYTRFIKRNVDYPVFCALDFIESEAAFRLLPKPPAGREELSQRFWREILESGYITDVFMTPQWELSKGATNEYQTAKRLNLRIHQVVRKSSN